MWFLTELKGESTAPIRLSELEQHPLESGNVQQSVLDYVPLEL
ncbi:MAG: hypothetical protein ACR2PZ_13970 [Pseudomonadales bacterium]